MRPLLRKKESGRIKFESLQLKRRFHPDFAELRSEERCENPAVRRFEEPVADAVSQLGVRLDLRRVELADVDPLAIDEIRNQWYVP